MNKWKFGLIVLGILLVAWLLDSLFHWEERKVQSRIEKAAESIEKQEPETFRQSLADDFSFDSPVPMVGTGNFESAKLRLQSFWAHASSVVILIRESEIQIAKDEATVQLRGNLKFQIPQVGMLGIYKFRATFILKKSQGEWKIWKAQILELEPGIF